MAYADRLRYDSITTLSSCSRIVMTKKVHTLCFCANAKPTLVRYDSRDLEEEGAPYPKITVLSINV